ncbi:MAG: amino acid adenylation domain-containing protein [Bacteroidales bacterium]|nr:amino acid adenylation domain-containing protein [Bacteroidales bacterium]
MIGYKQILLTHLYNVFNQNINNNAFLINNQYYTYLQFAQRISAIREEICKLQSNEQVFALAIHDDLDTYASIFALWMEGKAYVPLHPNQPLERNLNIIQQVGLSNVLDSADTSVFENYSLNIMHTSQYEYTTDYLDNWIETSDDALAYILFTSGSTGVPKGVQITRGNIAAFMDSFWKTGINITEEDRCLQVFDLTFDVSVQSYLVALTRGACVYTVPYGQVKYLYAASLIQEYKITFGAMAPSMLTYLRPYFDEFDATSMRTTILTAEACPVDLMEDWYKCAKNTEIYDFYGPTEATIYCTYYHLNRDGNNLSQNGIISIGRPMANVQAIIMREDGQLVVGQEKGELCIAGGQVTPGYWNNEEKNASSFFARDGIRYYHTGDLCYWDESGNILYCGRIDQQAKIQGFRVELGEIEYHAREFYNKEYRVVAIAFDNAQKLTEIALFVESTDQETQDLLVYLRSKMPHYMIPSRIIFEPNFPLNKSEKIDRNSLKLKLNM